MTSGMNNDEPIIGKVAYSPKENLIQTGDVILEIDEHKINSFSDIYLIAEKKYDKRVLKVNRNGKIKSFEVETLFPPIVESVEFMSPAAKVGVLPGDYIESVNGTKISNFGELKEAISGSVNRDIKLEVIRGESFLNFFLEKRHLVTEGKNGNLEEVLRIGISGRILLKPQMIDRPLLSSFSESLRAVVYIVRLTLISIINIITAAFLMSFFSEYLKKEKLFLSSSMLIILLLR